MDILDTMIKIFEKIKANGWESMTTLSIPEEAKLILMKGLLKSFIFNHDVAKAFWGEEDILIDFTGTPDGITDCSYLPAWQYHLRIMVLEKEPLKYMEKFLKIDQKIISNNDIRGDFDDE